MWIEVILSGKNSIIWTVDWKKQEKLDKIFDKYYIKIRYLQSSFIIFVNKTKLNCFLNISTYFDITEHLNIKIYLNIAEGSFKSVKLKKDKGLRRQKTKYKKVINDTPFLVTRPNLAI